MKTILNGLFLLIMVAIGLSMMVWIDRLQGEVKELQGSGAALEKRLTDLEGEVSLVKTIQLREIDVEEIWEGFGFPISLTGMRVFIGMFLDAINDGSVVLDKGEG